MEKIKRILAFIVIALIISSPCYAQWAMTYYSLGIAYGKKGMLDEAIDEFKKALVIDPKLASAHKKLAIAYYLKVIMVRLSGTAIWLKNWERKYILSSFGCLNPTAEHP